MRISPGRARGLAVAEEEVASGTSREPRRARERHRRVEREQHRRRVANRRGGHQVAAERGAVADQRATEKSGSSSASSGIRSAPAHPRVAPRSRRASRRRRSRSRRRAASTPRSSRHACQRRSARGGRSPFWVTPTMRSVPPATSVAPGADAHRREQLRRLVGPDEAFGAVASRSTRSRARRPRARRAGGSAGSGVRQAARDVGDGPVAGAAAQVAADRFGIEAVAARAVVLAEQADDEAGRAVAALRSAGADHRVLHRVQAVAAPARRLDGHDRLAVRPSASGHQTAVDRLDSAVARARRPQHGDGAGAALALGAALLGAGQAAGAEPLEQRDVWRAPARSRRAVRSARSRTAGHDPVYPGDQSGTIRRGAPRHRQPTCRARRRRHRGHRALRGRAHRGHRARRRGRAWHPRRRRPGRLTGPRRQPRPHQRAGPHRVGGLRRPRPAPPPPAASRPSSTCRSTASR